MDRIEVMSRALVEGIKRELADAASFTRDDLLYLSVFDSVATITRYAYVCKTVRYAVERKWLLEINRVELCLFGGKSRYREHAAYQGDYDDMVKELVQSYTDTFRLTDLFLRWVKTDQHISSGTKRTILRLALRKLKSEGVIDEPSYGEYRRIK